MGIIYHWGQNYNELKRKQYEDYIKRQNKYYMYKKKYFEEYCKKQSRYYLYKKKCFREYIKRQKKYYLYKKKYDKEHHKRNNDIFANKINYDKTDREKYNNTKNDNIKKDNYDSLINVKENNLEYKKDDLIKNDKLKNKNFISIEDSHSKASLEKNYNTDEKEQLSKELNIPNEGIYLKIPVILAEINITIPVEVTITLEEAVIEVKRVKKNVFLNQYNLVPHSQTPSDDNSGILFIAGFIRKNIEYVTRTFDTAGIVNSYEEIRNCTVEVPFNFTTKITFLRPPIFIKNITTSEVEFFKDSSQAGNFGRESLFGHDFYEQSFVFTEVFNEKPFVELVKATSSEVNIHKNEILSHEGPIEEIGTQITEKIILNLTLDVLQKQQVRVGIIE